MVETPPRTIGHASEPTEGYEEPCRLLEKIDAGLPDGYRTEIIRGRVALTDIDSIHLPGEALSLVGEFTSRSTADFDRRDKVEVYGRAGVPVYVLVDMLETTVTVYSSPSDQGYRSHTQVKFGDKVQIPAPFDCELDTADWQA
ncbi:Uma2 family endonuclease [Streptomyces netropsis]